MATADAERRRLERDLHDGAQQQLVALTLNLGLARDGLLADPEGTVEALDRLAADARLAIDQLRELAHGIYPPLLMDLGLAGALTAVARRSPQAVAVVATGAPAPVPTARPPSTSAAWRRCRTWPSTHRGRPSRSP